MFLGQNDKKGSNPLEIAAFLFGCLKPISTIQPYILQKNPFGANCTRVSVGLLSSPITVACQLAIARHTSPLIPKRGIKV